MAYQAIFYCHQEHKYWLRDDEYGWSDFKYYPTYYIESSQGEFQTLEGKNVKAIKKIDNWKDPKYYEKDVNKHTRLLVDTYYESDEVSTNHNIVYLDIECEILGALTPDSIKIAEAKITSISIYDVKKDKYYCLILDEENKLKSEKKDNKIIVSYQSESLLLKEFLQLWKKIDPTIISGWNSGFFDIPYLYYRITKILGEENSLKLSPINKVTISEYTPDQPVSIGGVNHLDYMLLFKKFTPKQEPSYRLGDIGEKYVNLGKIEYEGNLDKLFNEDKNKFIDYNIRDVEIIIELDKKFKFLDLTLTICHLCHVDYEQIYQSTMLNEGAILTYLKRKGIVSPNKPTTYNPSLKHLIEEYAGGYLKDPTPGLYEWVIDLDFTSLYPSIIRSLNMGIETLMGRIVNRGKFDNMWSLKELREMDPNEELTIEKVKFNKTLSQSKIKAGKLLNLIEEENLILSAPGVIFRKDKSSVVCEILNDWFAKRQEYKQLMKKSYKDGDILKGEYYNRLQHAYKIKLNDVYGVFAINGWRYTDGNKFISKAITLTGQRLLTETIDFINNYLNKELKTKDIDYIITGDTDSVFIHVKDLLLKRYPNLDITDKEEVIPKILELASELQKISNKNLDSLVVNLFNLHDSSHFFELKQEVVIERGYFAGKRRYAQWIVNKEGNKWDELDMKGLDLMKSNFPPLFKNFGEKIIKEIMFGESKNSIDKQILDFKESLKTIDWKKLMKPTGLKQLDSYIASKPTSGEIFSRLEKRCPINTRAASNFNDIIRFKKLDKKYSTFQIGDKMNIAYLKQNPYGIEVIGFNGYNDPPEITKLIENYVDRDGIFNGVMKNKIEKVYKDIGWGDVVFNKNVHKFFDFT